MAKPVSLSAAETQLPCAPPASHVVNVHESSSEEYKRQAAPSIFDLKPPPLLEDPDGKARFGDSSGSKFKKVLRFFLSFENHPWVPLIFVVAWSAIAVGIATAAAYSYTPAERSKCRYMCTPVGFEYTVAAYVGLALFLLLGFRVNEAYGRYERGLEIWKEYIGTTMTSFATHAGRVFPEELFHTGDRRRIFGWLVAFPVCVKRKLRGEREVPELASVLSQSDLQALEASPNMPLYCLTVLNAYIVAAAPHQADFPQHFLDRMLEYTSKLSLANNKCENIAEYAINYGYLAHLRLFMTIWMLILPFSLVQESGWYTCLLVPFIAYGILGMERIASELTQPFVRCQYSSYPSSSHSHIFLIFLICLFSHE